MSGARILLLAALLGVAGAPDGRAQSPTEIELPLAGGAPARGLAAGPTDADAALLIVHDWFGITEFTRTTVERFADAGYRVLAVDLYDGASATTHEQASELLNGLDRARVDAALLAALDALATEGRAIGVLGFSAGAAPAFGLSLRETARVDAAVVVYGGGIDAYESEALAPFSGALLVVTGSRDPWALDAALALLPRLEAADRSMELFVYPGAQHAYAQPLFNGGANYDAEATRVTWRIIDDFLARRLGTS